MIVICGRSDLTNVTGARCTRCQHEVDHEGILLLPHDLLEVEGDEHEPPHRAAPCDSASLTIVRTAGPLRPVSRACLDGQHNQCPGVNSAGATCTCEHHDGPGGPAGGT